VRRASKHRRGRRVLSTTRRCEPKACPRVDPHAMNPRVEPPRLAHVLRSKLWGSSRSMPTLMQTQGHRVKGWHLAFYVRLDQSKISGARPKIWQILVDGGRCSNRRNIQWRWRSSMFSSATVMWALKGSLGCPTPGARSGRRCFCGATFRERAARTSAAEVRRRCFSDAARGSLCLRRGTFELGPRRAARGGLSGPPNSSIRRGVGPLVSSQRARLACVRRDEGRAGSNHVVAVGSRLWGPDFRQRRVRTPTLGARGCGQ
jgi:hypothetical protein